MTHILEKQLWICELISLLTSISTITNIKHSEKTLTFFFSCLTTNCLQYIVSGYSKFIFII